MDDKLVNEQTRTGIFFSLWTEEENWIMHNETEKYLVQELDIKSKLGRLKGAECFNYVNLQRLLDLFFCNVAFWLLNKTSDEEHGCGVQPFSWTRMAN